MNITDFVTAPLFCKTKKNTNCTQNIDTATSKYGDLLTKNHIGLILQSKLKSHQFNPTVWVNTCNIILKAR